MLGAGKKAEQWVGTYGTELRADNAWDLTSLVEDGCNII